MFQVAGNRAFISIRRERLFVRMYTFGIFSHGMAYDASRTINEGTKDWASPCPMSAEFNPLVWPTDNFIARPIL